MADNAEKAHEVSRVLWQILVLNLLVAISKVTIGLITGTISIIADGIHSTVDGASNIVGLVAQRFVVQPPDDEHPYGHERFETLATLAIGGLLLLTAWEVLKTAIDHLISGNVPSVGVLQFVVLIGTLIVNVLVARYEYHKAKQLNSQLLEADSEHTTSDIWVTISVIISLIAVELGLVWMDAAAALGIVALIGFIAFNILRRTSMVLVDSAPIRPEAITQAIRGTPGVQKVIRARSRGTKDAVHMDLDVEVASVTSAESVQNITEAIRERVTHTFPHISEVRIQVATETNGNTDYLTIARAAADMMGLGVHEIIGVSTPQGKILEMHVEVKSGVTLREAHHQIEQLEARILQQPNVTEVVTHIEPAASGNALLASSPEAEQLRDTALKQLQTQFPQGHWHHSNIRRDGYGYGFAFTTHCHLPGDISIEIAHQIAEEAELSLRSTFPQLRRVTIHTEPEDGDMLKPNAALLSS